LKFFYWIFVIFIIYNIFANSINIKFCAVINFDFIWFVVLRVT